MFTMYQCGLSTSQLNLKEFERLESLAPCAHGKKRFASKKGRD